MLARIVVNISYSEKLKGVYTHVTMAQEGGAKVQNVMVQPINLIFRYLQNRSRIQV